MSNPSFSSPTNGSSPPKLLSPTLTRLTTILNDFTTESEILYLLNELSGEIAEEEGKTNNQELSDRITIQQGVNAQLKSNWRIESVQLSKRGIELNDLI